MEDEETKSWQQMHIISERWKSDLTFFNDELSFFRKLIDKKNVSSTRKLASDLSKLEKRLFRISQRLSQHGKHVANLLENPFSHNAQECKGEHGQLETLFADFTKDFREIKSKIFIIIKHVIDSEKERHFLDGSE